MPTQGFTFSLLAALIWLAWVRPQLVLYAIILLPIAGEFGRLAFLTDSGFLISDLVIGIFIAVWICKKILALSGPALPDATRRTNPLVSPLLLFITAGFLSLLQSFFFLKFSEVLAGSLYLVRFGEYVLLGLAATEILNTSQKKRTAITLMVITALAIACAGFIQLIIYPNLGKLAEFGWDPHKNRLVSTWLDPNFVAGFLSFVILLLSGITVFSKGFLKKSALLIIIVVLTTALVFTFSRSGYIAFLCGMLFIGIFRSRKLLIAILLLIPLVLNFSWRVQQRVDDLVHSATSIAFQSAENPDATARLRIKSWEQTLQLIAKRPLLGSGYNTLRYIKFNEGFVGDTQIHSASGSDSSLLTILATTGILGFIPFILLYWRLFSQTIQNWRQKKSAPPARGYAFGLLAGLISLFIHSLFVNSLLFPPILLFTWLAAGLL